MIVRLKGGLGNQMFQCALGRALSFKLNKKLKFDLTALLHRLPGRKYVFRNYDLDIFSGLDLKFTMLSKIARWGFPFNDICFIVEQIIIKVKSKINSRYYYKEKGDYLFDGNIFKSGAKFFDGYFQSYKYFDDIKDQIKKDFSLKFDFTEKEKNLADRIVSSNSICLNVRRTDYVSNELNKDFFGSIGMEYYKQAIDLIKEKIENPHFFIFSDDVNWCENNFTFLENKAVVGHEYAGKKFATYLKLMTQCKNFIIPNSTFAWWGAWLAENENKIVIAPKQWVADSEINDRTKDLIPDSWIRI